MLDTIRVPANQATRVGFTTKTLCEMMVEAPVMEPLLGVDRSRLFV